jgi:serine/threonine protein kinase
MCDLFILGKYLRLHHKIASKQKLIFKYESDLRLADFPITTDPTVLKNIASIVFFYYVAQLFEAVYTLHTHNIPARCITPSNVLWN